MAHGITYLDRYGEVRKNGQRAWHGLGDEIEEGLSAEDGFKEIGLGRPTILAPVFAQVPKVDLEGRVLTNDEGQEETQFIKVEGIDEMAKSPLVHMYRPVSDNLTYQHLGMVTEGYRPFENMDLARFADALAGADAAVTIETGGTLYGGRRVFCLVKLPEAIRVSSNDVLDQYVLVSNGHGGFAAFACYPTSVRVVCANTLRWSERDISRGLKFRHTGDWEEKVIQARVALGIAFKETELFEEKVMYLRKTKMSVLEQKEWMGMYYDKIFGKVDKSKLDEASFEKLTKKRQDVLEQWGALLDHETNRIDDMQGTAWQTLNAVTWWQDHGRGRFMDIDKSPARVASNIFGISSKQKRVAFNSLLTTV